MSVFSFFSQKKIHSKGKKKSKPKPHPPQTKSLKEVNVPRKHADRSSCHRLILRCRDLHSLATWATKLSSILWLKAIFFSWIHRIFLKPGGSAPRHSSSPSVSDRSRPGPARRSPASMAPTVVQGNSSSNGGGCYGDGAVRRRRRRRDPSQSPQWTHLVTECRRAPRPVVVGAVAGGLFL